MNRMNELNQCGICLDNLEKTNFCVTNCGHSFCLDCIIKNTNYNQDCPYCRTKIYENLNIKEKEPEIQTNVEVEQYNYIGNIDEEDDCYHFPVVIENIQTLAKVINEVTGGTFSSDLNLGWILGILSIINDNEETKFNIINDDSFQNEILLAEYSKLIIMEAVYIFKRSILLNNHLEKRFR